MDVFIEIILMLKIKLHSVHMAMMNQIIDINFLMKSNIQYIGMLEKIREKYDISLDDFDSIYKEVQKDIRENGSDSVFRKALKP